MKEFIGLILILVLLSLLKPMGFQKQATLSNLLNCFLVGEPSIPIASSARRKGKPKPQTDSLHSRSSEPLSPLSKGHQAVGELRDWRLHGPRHKTSQGVGPDAWASGCPPSLAVGTEPSLRERPRKPSISLPWHCFLLWEKKPLFVQAVVVRFSILCKWNPLNSDRQISNAQGPTSE